MNERSQIDLEKQNQEAAADGIEDYDSIRNTLIAWRNDALTAGPMEGAVLLSHVIWWLSRLTKVEPVKEPVRPDLSLSHDPGDRWWP